MAELAIGIAVRPEAEPGSDESSAERERYLGFYEGKEPSLSILRNHVINVADLAVILARELAFSESELESIFRVSILHDIGRNNEDSDLIDEITAFGRRHNISTTFVGLRKQLKDEGMKITTELEDNMDEVLAHKLKNSGFRITPEIKRHLRTILYHEQCAIDIIMAANIQLSILEELLIRYHSYPSELTPKHIDRFLPEGGSPEERNSLVARARRLLSVLVAADTIEAASSYDRTIRIPGYHRSVESLEDLFSSIDRKYGRGDINKETFHLVNNVLLSQDREFLGIIKKARHINNNEPLPNFDAETLARRAALLDLVGQDVIVSEGGLLQDTRGHTLDKCEIDFLVGYLCPGRTLDDAGRSLFSRIDEVALSKGYENLPAQSRYAFQKLLAAGGKLLVDEAGSLTETAKQELRTLFDAGEISFASVSEDILYGLIEEREGFTGYSDTTAFTGMPRCLFIGPAHFPMGSSDTTIRARRLYPHSYRTASFLEQHGVPVDIYDVNLDGWVGLGELIEEKQYDFISLSPSNPVSEADVDLAKLISRDCPNSVLILAGEGAVLDYRRFLEIHRIPAVVIRGYGSKFMLDMMVNYKKKHPAEQMKFHLYNCFRRIPNLYVQDADGTAISTGLVRQFAQKYLRVVSRVINYTKVPYEKYWDADLDRRPSVDFLMTEEEKLFYRDTVRIVTKSHCPRKCAFCGYNHFLDSSISRRTQPVLALPADDIHIMVRKILHAYPRFRKNGLVFLHDDDFVGDETEEMLRLLQSGYGLGEDVVYFGFTRIDKVNDVLLERLYRAGFRKLLYGIETFSDRLLRVMNKSYGTSSPAELVKKVVRSTLNAGIIPVITLILFYPYADFDDVKVTIDKTVELVAEGAIPNVYPFAEARAGADLTREARSGKMEIVGKYIMPVDSRLRDLACLSLSRQEAVSRHVRERYNWRHIFSPALAALVLFKAIYHSLGIPMDRIDEVTDVLVNRYRDELIRNLFRWMETPEQEKICSPEEVTGELERRVPDYCRRIEDYLSAQPGATNRTPDFADDMRALGKMTL